MKAIFEKLRPAHLLRGDQSERHALIFLKQQRLQLVEKNYRCRFGEIDLIMTDGDTLVFVEVRYRRSNQYGGAIESVTRRKQSRIIATAEYYLAKHPVNSSVRFDVIACTGEHDIEWIKNAFSC